MLKFCYDNESDIPEAVRSHYKKSGDGKWYLEIEGAVAKAKVDEFRDNNTRLQNELADLKTKYKDVDPAEYSRLKGIETDLQNGKLSDKAKDVLETRTAEMKRAHEAETTALKAERDTARRELEGLKIGEAAINEGLKLGLRPTAKDDLTMRVKSQFKLNEKGEVRAYSPDGKEIYGPTGGPLTIGEYVAGLVKSADHLFAPSEGTGASGGSGGSTVADGVNPWKKETWNITKQSQIYAKDPAKAKAMAKAAGAKVPGE